MRRITPKARTLLAAAVLFGIGASAALPVLAQTAPSPSRTAIETRKALFVLIRANFGPLGDVVKGTKPYDAADAEKRLTRLAFLADFLNEAFPDVSNTGEPDTKAKAEIWTNHADFDKKVKEFQAHTKTLVQVNATEKGATDAFKAAFAAVGGDCKGCHDDFKVK